MLAKETLVKDITIGDIEYKAGEKIPLDVIKTLADLLFVLLFNHIIVKSKQNLILQRIISKDKRRF